MSEIQTVVKKVLKQSFISLPKIKNLLDYIRKNPDRTKRVLGINYSKFLELTVFYQSNRQDRQASDRKLKRIELISPNISIQLQQAIGQSPHIVNDYIRDRLTKDITLSELADVVKMSQYRFARAFK